MLFDHGPERDRSSRRLDAGNAVFPRMAGGARHHVERAGRGIERKALPRVAAATAEAKLAKRAQRQAEHLVEMRLVAMPADADPGIVFGAEDLPDPGRGAAER